MNSPVLNGAAHSVSISTQVSEELSVIYEDEALWVVNKPSGLLAVPGRGADRQDCVINRLLAIGSSTEAHAPHRLDMCTSGLTVVAKTKQALKSLNRQFANRQIYKRYSAIVMGVPESNVMTCEYPLICDWPNRPRQKVCENGKSALTHIAVKSVNVENGYSLVELHPVTGRSHQLRVHMQALGFPIIGDEFYAHSTAQEAASRLLLHASQLAFSHPCTQKILLFTCAKNLEEFLQIKS